MENTAPTRDAAREQVLRTLTRLKHFLNGPSVSRMSEADTKFNFIEPHIAALGFEAYEDISREYYVRSSQEFIDYVLKLAGRPVIAIEAKALQADLTDKHSAQLVQYCSVEGIEWCILTNGRELRLYNANLHGGLEAKLVSKLDLLAFNSDDEYGAIFDQIWLLSKESMAAPTRVRSWMEWRRLDRALRRLLLSPLSSSIAALRKELELDSVTVSPEDVVNWFRQELIPADATVIAAAPLLLPAATDDTVPVLRARTEPRKRSVPKARSQHEPRLVTGKRVTLSELIAEGLLRAPMPVRLRTGGRNMTGEITPSGQITANGQTFTTPSSAAQALTGWQAADGWVCWECYDERTSAWVRLAEIRKRLPRLQTAAG